MMDILVRSYRDSVENIGIRCRQVLTKLTETEDDVLEWWNLKGWNGASVLMQTGEEHLKDMVGKKRKKRKPKQVRQERRKKLELNGGNDDKTQTSVVYDVLVVVVFVAAVGLALYLGSFLLSANVSCNHTGCRHSSGSIN
jgi:hypothetical protein